MLNKLKRASEVIFIERRLPYSWEKLIQKTLYEKPLKDCLMKSVDAPPAHCNPDAPTELHLVTCERDTYMAILALKSLLRFVPNLAVVIHGDETLLDSSISTIKQAIPGSRFITYVEANENVKRVKSIATIRSRLPELFKLDSSFERQRKAWALKIFDFHLYSKTNKIIVLDSDTLFLQKPDELIEWINKPDAPAFHAVPYLPNLMVDHNLYKKVFPGAKVIESFNGGFFGFDKHTLPLESVMEIAKKLLENPDVAIFGDECIWRFAFSKIESTSLPYEIYPIFGMMKRFKQYSAVQDKFKYIHFLLKHKGGLYKKFACRILLELNSEEKNINNPNKVWIENESSNK